jgi:glutamate 5-kinase
VQRLKSILQKRNTVVIKIGTNLLADRARGIDGERLADVARSVRALRSFGKNVALVSSGAIGAGVAAMGLEETPRTVPEKQATAAIGQPLLMEAYERAFRQQRLAIAQILLTRDDFTNRGRYLNTKNTFRVLFEKGVVPIINENDTVAVEEIKLGDNDNLSAMVATLIEAGVLIVLSDIDGLFSDDPFADPDAKLIEIVEKITPEVQRCARQTRGELSTGGMVTKIQAAKRCAAAGIAMVITNGRSPDAINRVLTGDFRGTLFLPAEKRLSMRKQWIGLISRPNGHIMVDEGARSALLKQHKSLLPSGILEVRGRFKAHDVIVILGPEGQRIGKGITGFSSDELHLIKGKKTSEVEGRLGRRVRAGVVPRDNFAPLGDPT